MYLIVMFLSNLLPVNLQKPLSWTLASIRRDCWAQVIWMSHEALVYSLYLFGSVGAECFFLYLTVSTSVLNHPVMVTLNIKVTTTEPESPSEKHPLNQPLQRMFTCVCVCALRYGNNTTFQWENKPHKESKREEKHKGRRPVMNISGIPQLHAAAGFSLGEAVTPAKSHRSRTLQGVLLSPYWPKQSRTGSVPRAQGRAH